MRETARANKPWQSKSYFLSTIAESQFLWESWEPIDMDVVYHMLQYRILLRSQIGFFPLTFTQHWRYSRWFSLTIPNNPFMVRLARAFGQVYGHRL